MCTLTGECTASLADDGGGGGGEPAVTFNSSEGVGPDWEAGLVRTLTGECTASLADHGVCVGSLHS